MSELVLASIFNGALAGVQQRFANWLRAVWGDTTFAAKFSSEYLRAARAFEGLVNMIPDQCSSPKLMSETTKCWGEVRAFSCKAETMLQGITREYRFSEDEEEDLNRAIRMFNRGVEAAEHQLNAVRERGAVGKLQRGRPGAIDKGTVKRRGWTALLDGGGPRALRMAGDADDAQHAFDDGNQQIAVHYGAIQALVTQMRSAGACDEGDDDRGY